MGESTCRFSHLRFLRGMSVLTPNVATASKVNGASRMFETVF